MQYILTEEEYKNLVPKSKYEEKCKENKELQQLLMKAAVYICIYDPQDKSVGFYCDNCPLAHFDCGKRKEFSK
jgi:hypothetical protein